jgi:4-alpha-glucanotransferase
MAFPRLSGILLHPTSLPSLGGIGDFGPAAYEFVDFLAEAGQGLWQVLPLGPPAYGDSPYSSTSAFAGSPLFISLERLADHGWITRECLSSLPQAVDSIDFVRVQEQKLPLIREAAENFLNGAEDGAQTAFGRFCDDNAWWLEDYVLYDALRAQHGKTGWNLWPKELAQRDPIALDKARRDFAREISIGRTVQFFFWQQWEALRSYCAVKSIRLVGDIAIFVDHDSADVWAKPHLWRLDEDFNPVVVSGVPPDAFSETGQRWGNPLYDWDAMRADEYRWWVQRLRWAAHTCDYIRLDHFRGFEQFWEIPASEPTAVNGQWVNGPKDELFEKLEQELGELPFFAEDLGYITPEVHALRERHKIPGMAVLQFGFGDVGAHVYLPHRLSANRVVYTGTHDNDTSRGWWESLTSAKEKEAVEAYLGCPEDGVSWAMIRAALASPANFAIFPLQDVLGLGSEARLNTPSKVGGNYLWRYPLGSLTPELSAKLAATVGVTDRLPKAITTERPAKFFA